MTFANYELTPDQTLKMNLIYDYYMKIDNPGENPNHS